MKNSRSPRILLVGPDWMGDVLFSTPLVRALRKAYPDAFLGYSTNSRCREVLEGNPYLDAILSYDEKPFLLNILENTRFISELRKLKFEKVLYLHRSTTRAFLGWCGGISERVGYARKKRDWLLTRQLTSPNRDVHRIDIYLGLLEALGVEPHGREMDYTVLPKDRTAWQTLQHETPLKDSRSYAVLHPGGNWELKRWPLDYFKELVHFFESRGLCVAVTGSISEKPLAEELLAHAKPGTVVSLCGKTSIRTLACLLEGSRIIVSNDSGPIHLTAALGVPLVGVFGPTDLELTGPISRGPMILKQHRLGCEIPCYFDRCHHRVCMENLKPQDVMAACEEILDEAKVSHGN